MKSTLQETPRILQQLLSQHLDQDTSAFVESMPNDLVSERHMLVVDQRGNEFPSKTSLQLCSPSGESRVVAIVDRSANIAAAASAVAQARVAFNGQSPYAPDLVLVNEFVVNDFMEAAVKIFTQHLPGAHSVHDGGVDRVKRRRREREDPLTKEERTDPDTTVVLEGDNGSLVRIGNRQVQALVELRTGN